MTSTESYPTSVDFDRSGSCLTVYVSGDLDGHGAPMLERLVLGRIGDTSGIHVVLDVSTVTFCDSRGLRAMVSLHQAAAALGGDLIIQDPTPMTRRLLSITALDRALTVIGKAPKPRQR